MSGIWLAVGSEAAKGEAAKSGPWGFAIILLLGVACYFLFKSMSRHMKYVREHPPTEADGRTAPGTVAGSSAPTGPVGSGRTEPADRGERTVGADDADPPRA